MQLTVLAMFAALVTAVLPVPREDLGQIYTSTLTRDADDPEPLDWVCEPEDVWRLSAFEFEFEKQLKIKLRASTAVIGRHDGNAIWAVVLPDKPAKLTSTLGGEGDKIEHIWLRFHPSRIGELFPERTVRGNGPADARLAAYRLYAHKVADFWATRWKKPEGEKTRPYFSGQRPVLPPESVVVLDMDTEGERRRVFSVDLKARTARSRAAYLTRTLPQVADVDRRTASEVFDRACVVGEELRAAGLGASVEWEAHVGECRRGIGRGGSAFEVAAAIHTLLSPLDPDCLRLRVGKEYLPAVQLGRPARNVDTDGVNQILSSYAETKAGVFHGRTQWGVGYVRVDRVDDPAWVDEFDGVLDDLADEWALVLDLRYGVEGKPELLERLAGRLVSESTPYGVHVRWKDGEERETPLAIEPRGPWAFGGVVCALTGPVSAIEAERLALIVKVLPKGFLVGEPTAGIGVGADWQELAPGLELFARAGRTLDASGELLPLDGLVPDTLLVAEPEEMTGASDPVLYKALEEIYLVPHEERRKSRSGEQWPWPEVQEAGASEEGSATEAGG